MLLDIIFNYVVPFFIGWLIGDFIYKLFRRR